VTSLQQAQAIVAAADSITVLTGAGISTDSGIPDFRGPHGTWTKNPAAEKRANIGAYIGDESVRRAAWQDRLYSPTWQAEPNAGHRALVALERSGRLRAVLTQNVDELHQRAGNSPDRVIELHGTMRRVICLGCGQQGPMEPALERVRSGEQDPACRDCGGILKSATISFGQPLDLEVLAAAERAALSCDLFVAVGTTLMVHPAAGYAPLAKRAGAKLVIVNADPTPYDDIADAVVNGSISEVLPALVGA
jgi:NAD-dependent deacetylase